LQEELQRLHRLHDVDKPNLVKGCHQLEAAMREFLAACRGQNGADERLGKCSFITFRFQDASAC